MFQPKKYKKEDPDYIYNFIDHHPFATLVLKGDHLLATHIPVLLKGTPEDFVLFGHIAQANEQYKYLKDDLDALLIFQGAHDYVSSSWYREKNISTWDYSAVHVNVKLKIQTDEEFLDSLKALIHRFEKGQKNPLFYEELPEKMVEEHLPLITGFWCEPIKIQAIAKLHQGFERPDVDSVIEHLQEKKNPMASELIKDIQREHGKDH